MRHITLLIILSWFAHSSVTAQANRYNTNAACQKWVDNIYNKLTIEERIGQLFMVPVFSSEKINNSEGALKLIKARQIGGVIFMHGSPTRQADLTNEFQQEANVPLLIATDAEWGVGMRMDSVLSLPKAQMLGATRDSLLAYRAGTIAALQCKRMGIQVDLAPDADVNSNPMNPIINGRAFSSDKTLVARLSTAYMHGLQDHGVIACAKHFPGHGDTKTDSHKNLPQVTKTLAQLDTLELYPFKELIKGGLQGIMTAHLDMPKLDSGLHISATLSKNVITGLLKEKMGFKGLVFTDALNMVGVTRYFHAGEAELLAFEAGNDVLVFPGNIQQATNMIKGALISGRISKSYFEEKVKKILAAKYDAGLAHWTPIDTKNLIQGLNKDIDALNEEATAESVTVIGDEPALSENIKSSKRIGYIGVHTQDTTLLYKKLHDKLPGLSAGLLPKGSLPEKANSLLKSIDSNDVTIVAVHKFDFYPALNYGFDKQELAFLRQIVTKKNVVVILLGNAYAMQDFGYPRSGIVTYEDDNITEDFAAKIILRKKQAMGVLPFNK